MAHLHLSPSVINSTSHRVLHAAPRHMRECGRAGVLTVRACRCAPSPLSQIFSSTCRYGRWFTWTLWLSVLLFLIFLFLGVGVKHTLQTASLIVAFVEL